MWVHPPTHSFLSMCTEIIHSRRVGRPTVTANAISDLQVTVGEIFEGRERRQEGRERCLHMSPVTQKDGDGHATYELYSIVELRKTRSLVSSNLPTQRVSEPQQSLGDD